MYLQTLLGGGGAFGESGTACWISMIYHNIIMARKVGMEIEFGGLAVDRLT